jgi:hypothetical protein
LRNTLAVLVRRRMASKFAIRRKGHRTIMDATKTMLWVGLGLWILTMIGHDLYIGFCTSETTYTMDIRRFLTRDPLIPFGIGLPLGALIGHLFWWN